MKQQSPSSDKSMIAVTGSMTTALRAQRTLAAAAIRSQVVKSDDQNGKGCGYGVTFDARQQNNVKTILTSAHINVRRYVKETWSFL